MLQHFGVVLRHRLRRDARHRRDRGLDFFEADRLLAPVFRQQHLRGARLVDHVDRLVGQLAVMDVARRQLDRRLDGVVGVFEPVVILEVGLEALHDLDGVRDRRLGDVDLLEAANERAILLEVLAVFLVGGRADAADRAGRQRRLEQVGRIHRAAGGRAGADHRVDLVDEHDGARVRLDLLDDLLQPLLEVAAIAGAGEQRAHVEREDGGVAQDFRHFAVDDAARQTFRDRGLADAGVADEQRVVLLAAAQHLDGAADLRVAADQRIDLAVARLFVEVDAIGLERVALLLAALFAVAGFAFGLLVDAARRTRLRHPGSLGDAVADVVDRVVARHVLLLQEIGGVAFALGEDRDQHVGAGHFFATGRLHMDDGALDHALEAGGRLGILAAVDDQIIEFGLDVRRKIAPQLVEIDVAGAHDRGGILIVDQRQQQVLERRVFVVALVGQRERAMQRLFETARESRHTDSSFSPLGDDSTFFPSRIATDVGACARSPSLASPWSRRPRR